MSVRLMSSAHNTFVVYGFVASVLKQNDLCGLECEHNDLVFWGLLAYVMGVVYLERPIQSFLLELSSSGASEHNDLALP